MNKKKGIVTAAIIVIGNEILSGRTQDLNVSLIAKWLNNLGITLYEVRIIPDIEKTIVKSSKKSVQSGYIPFRIMFRAARKAGISTFSWQGKLYNTKLRTG